MADSPPDATEAELPREPIHRLVSPLARYLHVEEAGGIVLFAAAVLALALANSPLADAYLELWKTELAFTVGDFKLALTLQKWVGDGLMAIFFFVVGLEVKRELVLGELRSPRNAALPFAAALGGMLVPAGIYLALQGGEPAARGWGIPVATDIAFAVGCLALVGSRVPQGLRVLLLSLAIVDDIGAILVIALVYTESLHLGWLGVGLGAIAVTMALARLGVRSVGVYVVLAVVVWLGFHESGVHATIAGVLLGLLTPTQRWVSEGQLYGIVRRVEGIISGDRDWEQAGQGRGEELRRVELAAREARSPLERLEALLHPWVSFVVMPLFAFANAGVAIDAQGFREGVAVAVAAGLVIGKPMGVIAFAWLAVRLGLAQLPRGADWGGVAAVGALAGVGFTMSLFIANLALDAAALDAAKIGVLSGSLVAGALGLSLLLVLLPKPGTASG